VKLLNGDRNIFISVFYRENNLVKKKKTAEDPVPH